MATVQITWVDASTNETKFNIYRGATNDSTPDITAANLVATLVYNSSATGADWANTKWANSLASGGSSSSTIDPSATFQLTAGNANLNTDSAQTYKATYTDDDTGSFKWAVTAENAIGASAAEETAALLAIN
jgi:hypothetical protein